MPTITLDSPSALVVRLRSRTEAMTVIEVAGEVDMDNAAQLLHEVTTLLPGDGDVALDLAAVTFLGSAGVLTLLRCREIAERRTTRLAISRAHRNVRQVLDICALTEMFHLTAA
ncbi:STAS domain-containing protein [Actinoplanes oblitus]|uniref:STAS domain-containing protein n=1 Tax=Actinoplanes oblitus TaxID=3040509 RepID=A0ABY8W4N2_9ACTN|nr:STAS domain-containing protein [Actinoplanes oblitus]WIM92467.1 STAS domain-containing protein [Actinoplanes oblitus]